MIKINKITITSRIYFALGILAILAFGALIMPTRARAYVINGSYVVEDKSSYVNYGYIPPNTYPTPNSTLINYSTTPVIYSSGSSTNQTNRTIIYRTVTAKNTSLNTNPVNTATTSSNQNSNTVPISDYSSLTANAVFGSNSLFPSGLAQWIIFAILVLLVVMLARKIFGADKKYHATPLKQA